RDPVLKQVIREIGPCTHRTEPDGFVALARSILAQQISARAALSIHTKLMQTLGQDGLTPSALLALSDESLRGAGLSRAKQLALRDLAERITSGAVDFSRVAEMADEEVIKHLVPVRGIGRWTAEMFLIFSLGRLDILPVGDFGFRAGVRDRYGLCEL